jgi:hypothetical protein
VLQTNGSGVLSFSSVSDNFSTKLFHVRDEKANLSSGGSSSAGVQTRVLNTVVTNQISGASLSSNQITLPVGTYYIDASAPCNKGSPHKAYLYNITDSSDAVVGLNAYTDPSDNVQTSSHVYGRFTIAGTKVFELKHWIDTAKVTNGLGVDTNAGNICIFANVMIWKVA